MTPIQQLCVNIIRRLNGAEFNSFFKVSVMMATIQVESAFRPKALRHEPSGVTSYGLCQVLDTTAAGLGLKGSPEQMFDPEISIRYGMKAHKHNWDALVRHFKRNPNYEEWAAAYNEGVGNVIKGRQDAAYTNVWIKAEEYWAQILNEA